MNPDHNTNKTVKIFSCDLNWTRAGERGERIAPASAQDYAFIDPKAYFDWHIEMGNTDLWFQAYNFSGFAYYPTKLGPVAPGPGQELLPRLYELCKSASVPFWGYMCVGADLAISNIHPDWLVPGSRSSVFPYGFLAHESPWQDLINERVAEFLTAYPCEWMFLDWFTYGSLIPSGSPVEPSPYVAPHFERIIGRPMPDRSAEITPDEQLHYKRTILAESFHRLRDTVRAASPGTKVIFNVPYHHAAEALWVDHPMLKESDGLFAECSKEDVVEWLLSTKRPDQSLMVTIHGRIDEGECDLTTGPKWMAKGCDVFANAFPEPPGFLPHPMYANEISALREVFR
jgi:hypothetical protein